MEGDITILVCKVLEKVTNLPVEDLLRVGPLINADSYVSLSANEWNILNMLGGVTELCKSNNGYVLKGGDRTTTDPTHSGPCTPWGRQEWAEGVKEIGLRLVMRLKFETAEFTTEEP